MERNKVDMKNIFSKIRIGLLIVAVLYTLTGCNTGKDIVEVMTQESTQETEQSRPLYVEDTEESVEVIQTTESEERETLTVEQQESASIEDSIETQETQSGEGVPTKAIEYGDRVTLRCNKKMQYIDWKYAGEEEFQVAATSKQFQNEFDLSEETTMKNMEQAIGKTVGDTFSLWYEGGDGLYGYEYTIVDVVSGQPDKVEYGDKIFTTYVMRGLGTDTGDGDSIFTGEQVIRVENTNAFLAEDFDGYLLSTAQYIIDDILGKGIGDTFWVTHEGGAASRTYQFTICGINKAIKQGDTIKTEVRKVCIPAEETENVSAGERITLELLTSNGTLKLAENELDIEMTRVFFREILGKTKGDRIVLDNRDKAENFREIYTISIVSVEPGEMQETDSELTALITAKEEEITFFYAEDEFKDGFSRPHLCYAIVEDAENDMVYEYSASNKHWSLNRSYGYKTEYDGQGRLLKETVEDYWDRTTYEYKYNEQGVCIERKTSYLKSEAVDYVYYDETGNFIRAEHISSGYREVREFVDGNPNQIQVTEYDADGNVETYTYEIVKDGWGF